VHREWYSCSEIPKVGFPGGTRTEDVSRYHQGVGAAALQLRPNCEYCDADLARRPPRPASTHSNARSARTRREQAHTFCPNCAENLRQNRSDQPRKWLLGLSVEMRPPRGPPIHDPHWHVRLGSEKDWGVSCESSVGLVPPELANIKYAPDTPAVWGVLIQSSAIEGKLVGCSAVRTQLGRV
jgi:hypothetical protein